MSSRDIAVTVPRRPTKYQHAAAHFGIGEYPMRLQEHGRKKQLVVIWFL